MDQPPDHCTYGHGTDTTFVPRKVMFYLSLACSVVRIKISIGVSARIAQGLRRLRFTAFDQLDNKRESPNLSGTPREPVVPTFATRMSSVQMELVLLSVLCPWRVTPYTATMKCPQHFQ
jgi:hypothetical protein